MIIAFTGHRILPKSKLDWISSVLQEKLIELKPSKVISGMALGFDQLAAEVAMKLNIPVIAAIPCDNQDAKWNISQREEYYRLLCKCYSNHIVSPGPYALWKMQARNVWMVDNSNFLISCFDGSSGGTKNCIAYGIDKPRINLDPLRSNVTYYVD
jgi:uncharacterized phage-like protein YoqJ